MTNQRVCSICKTSASLKEMALVIATTPGHLPRWVCRTCQQAEVQEWESFMKEKVNCGGRKI